MTDRVRKCVECGLHIYQGDKIYRSGSTGFKYHAGDGGRPCGPIDYMADDASELFEDSN